MAKEQGPIFVPSALRHRIPGHSGATIPFVAAACKSLGTSVQTRCLRLNWLTYDYRALSLAAATRERDFTILAKHLTLKRRGHRQLATELPHLRAMPATPLLYLGPLLDGCALVPMYFCYLFFLLALDYGPGCMTR